MEARVGEVGTGDFNALAMLIVDAVLDGDDASLRAAQDGLQRVYGEQSWLEDPSAEQMESRGRVLGMIDLVQWSLRRVVPKSLVARLEPDGYARRFLELVAETPGLSNTELGTQLGTDETQVSRTGRNLLASGLARKRKLGRKNQWEITPRGHQALGAQEATIRIESHPDVLHRLAEQVVESGGGDLAPGAPTVFSSRILQTILTAERSLTPREIASHTGLAKRSVTLAANLLTDRGYLRPMSNGDENPEDVPLSVNDGRYCAIGINVLRDRITGVVTDLHAEVLRTRDCSLLSYEPAAVVSAIADLVADLRRSAPGEPELPPCIVGLGVELGGHVDGGAGEVVDSPNFGWKHVELGSWLHGTTGLETVVENDVNALAVHEILFGSAIAARWFAAVAIDDGVGCGLVCEGQLLRGSSGAAGEFGHIVIDPAGPACRCGNVGCVEAFASTRAIVEAIAAEGVSLGSFEDAAELANSGNDVARSVFVAAGDAVGRALSILLNLTDPGRVLIAVPEALAVPDTPAASCFEKALRDAIGRHAFASLRASRIDIRHLPSRDLYSGRGAAASVLRRFVNRPLAWRPSATSLGMSPPAPPRRRRVAQTTGRSEREERRPISESIVLEGTDAESDPLGVLTEQLASLI
jgi:predicted NBD/HSP70 family sugar kinase